MRGQGRCGRRKKCRNLQFTPEILMFKPVWVPASVLESVIIYQDELESLRLKNIQWTDIIDWGEQMWISKSTFARIYQNCIDKISDAIINWKAIILDLQLNNNTMPNKDWTWPNGQGPKTGRGLGNCPKSDSNQSNTSWQWRRTAWWRGLRRNAKNSSNN